MTFLEILTSLCQRKAAIEDFDHHVQVDFKPSIDHSVQVVKTALHIFPYRPQFDICLGELRKKMIEIVVRSHAKNITFLNIYLGDILTLMLDNGDKMNTDDTDMLQYSLKYVLEGVTPKTLQELLGQGKTLLNLLKVLSEILLKNKKMVNLVKYLVEILGTGFDGKTITPGTEERIIFHKVIETAFIQNKENGEVMKELIMVGPYFCAK